MRTSLVRIGNSQGIRLPKALIAQCELRSEVELSVEGKTLMIRSTDSVRQGWDDQFKRMAIVGDDVLLDEELIEQSSWDAEEWEW